LNYFDSDHYGTNGELFGCENDASAMQQITSAIGYQSHVLLTQSATADAVLRAIKNVAAELLPGDLFVLTYSGHGAQVPDASRDELRRGDSDAEIDVMDETWCLYDRMLIDDELYAAWGEFRAGVRIFVLSDSCHSGSVVREQYRGAASSIDGFERTKNLRKTYEVGTYRKHRELYDSIQASHPQGDLVGVGAHILLISGCQDDQLARDGTVNGLFTSRLLDVWNSGAFDGSYKEFHSSIAERMPDIQMPNYYPTGVLSAAFEAQRPFTP
jgi:hypothetical protein